MIKSLKLDKQICFDKILKKGLKSNIKSNRNLYSHLKLVQLDINLYKGVSTKNKIPYSKIVIQQIKILNHLKMLFLKQAKQILIFGQGWLLK